MNTYYDQNKIKKVISNIYFLSLIPSYAFGIRIKNNVHQARIKMLKTEVITILLNSSQLKVITKTPKLIIDHG